MNRLTVIGDVHGKLDVYRQIVRSSDYSLSLGEMGFDLNSLVSDYVEGRIDGGRHLILPGNHDNYNVIPAINTFLCNPGYGSDDDLQPVIADSGVKAFYVRGAASIDRAWRTEGRDWFPEEELIYSDLNKALEEYEDYKPDVMFTHTCPDSLVDQMICGVGVRHNFRTEQALQAMLEIHQPKLWFFGHHHVTETFKEGDTTFVALGELAMCGLDLDTLELCF